MTRSIIGLFHDRVTATRALTELSAAGFDTAHLGVVLPDAPARRDDTLDPAPADPTAEAAVGGGVIGGTAGALLVATGALVIPGVGPFIAGGILASLVGGTAGWLAGGLVAQGLSHEEATEIEGRVQAGRPLVVVQTQGRDAEARAILLRAGADGLEMRGPGEGATSPYRRVEADTAEGS
jgi:outer membrane lipoprotein SlyB